MKKKSLFLKLQHRALIQGNRIGGFQRKVLFSLTLHSAAAQDHMFYTNRIESTQQLSHVLEYLKLKSMKKVCEIFLWGDQFVAETPGSNVASLITALKKTTRKITFSFFFLIPEETYCCYSWIPADRLGIWDTALENTSRTKAEASFYGKFQR